MYAKIWEGGGKKVSNIIKDKTKSLKKEKCKEKNRNDQL